MEFLTANTRGLLDGSTDNGSFISAKGKDVDRHRRRRHRHRLRRHGACGTAAGAWSSSRSCRSPPLDRAADNPWPQWPKVYRLDYGQEEAAAKFGADPRVYLTTAKKFVGDANGRVKEILTVQVEWERNDKGRFVPEEVPGTEQVRPAQLVLLAMGFLGPGAAAARRARRRTRPAHQRQGRVREVSPPTSRASSPPATAAAARAWWSGPSTKAAAPPASATAT